MRRRATAITVLAATTAAGSALAATASTAATTAAKPHTRTYRVHLSGRKEVPKAAARSSARARIRLNARRDRVCWRFTRMKDLPHTTMASIDHGRAGTTGREALALGASFKATGCTRASRAAVRAMERRPKRFYVNVDDRRHPRGAARGQL